MRPEPAFAVPWHAQVFAVTVALNEAGRFDWLDWAARFSETLVRHGLAKELDGGDDYFSAWLETLEAFASQAGWAEASEIAAMRDAWEVAYLRTPHGASVHLNLVHLDGDAVP